MARRLRACARAFLSHAAPGMHACNVAGRTHAARPDRTALPGRVGGMHAVGPGNRLALAPATGASGCGGSRPPPRVARTRAAERTRSHRHAREIQTATPDTVVAPDISPPTALTVNLW
jgi:hypothetical protein